MIQLQSFPIAKRLREGLCYIKILLNGGICKILEVKEPSVTQGFVSRFKVGKQLRPERRHNIPPCRLQNNTPFNPFALPRQAERHAQSEPSGNQPNREVQRQHFTATLPGAVQRGVLINQRPLAAERPVAEGKDSRRCSSICTEDARESRERIG